MLLVALIPILLALPQLTPWLKANPAYYVAGMTVDRGPAIQPGLPYIDPNSGFQTQALGYRAVMDWVSGEVPWWNPYTGIGMPLAAEYQAAAFFPLTALIALPRGTVLLQMVLQLIAGLGAYALARQLGLARLAAFTAGAMFAMNGTLAWLSHGPAGAVPWLPWILLGIERAWNSACGNPGGGWRLLAIAMGMSLLAGFPETAYINGLLALAWAILRGFQAPRNARARFALRVAAGGTVALAIASPQILSFLLFLRDSHIGSHAGDYTHFALEGPSVLMSLVAPYAVGPIFGYSYGWPQLYDAWASVGGYATLALVTAALYGLHARRDALAWLLAGWILSVLAKTFGVEPFVSLWNLVPGVGAAAFARFAQPTWELAFILLAARGIDALLADGPRRQVSRIAAYCVIAIMLAVALHAFRIWLRIPQGMDDLKIWFAVSMAWAGVSVAIVWACIAKPGRAGILAALLATEAAVFCAIPILSNPRAGTLDMPAIEFLRSGLGLQRFYTTEPIAPNYGALFGIASINHNYLPVPDAWVEHVGRNLDKTWKEGVVFNGDPTRNSLLELRANLAAYEAVGVKYVVTRPEQNPFAGMEDVKLAYRDSVLDIFELPRPRAYLEDSAGRCVIEAKERRAATTRCDSPSTLVRRELFYPGWSATVNGVDTPVTVHDGVFQAIALPAGSSEIRFRYAPAYIGWAWLASALGLAALLWRRSRQ